MNLPCAFNFSLALYCFCRSAEFPTATILPLLMTIASTELNKESTVQIVPLYTRRSACFLSAQIKEEAKKYKIAVAGIINFIFESIVISHELRIGFQVSFAIPTSDF